MQPSKQEITRLLLAAYQGDKAAENRLWAMVYDELLRIARRELQQEYKQPTLNTAALVNEAYKKLVDQTRITWHNRTHFYAIAYSIMRRILIDRGRRRDAEKRGGGQEHRPLEDAAAMAAPFDENVSALHEALKQLEKYDEKLVRVIECYYFLGLSQEETAEELDISVRTVQRNLKRARVYLKQALRADQDC